MWSAGTWWGVLGSGDVCLDVVGCAGTWWDVLGCGGAQRRKEIWLA